jgi:hypothetical protein
VLKTGRYSIRRLNFIFFKNNYLILFRYILNTRRIHLCGSIRTDTCVFYIILISGMWDISGDAHEPLDGDGIELAELSLDEPDLEVDLYLDDGNGGEEIETIIVN